MRGKGVRNGGIEGKGVQGERESDMKGDRP